MLSYRIKRALQVTSNGGGQCVAKNGERYQWLLTGPDWLARMMESLASGCSLNALVRNLAPDADPASVRAAVNNLRDEGVLEDAESHGLAEDTPRFESLHTYLSGCGIGPGQIARVRSGCRLAVVGTGAMADEVIKTLRSSGLDAEQISTMELVTTTPQPSLCIAADEWSNDAGRSALNDHAIRYGLPWLNLVATGHTAWIGPLFIPGQTACWQCFQSRLNSNRRYRLHPSGTDKKVQHTTIIQPAAPPPIFVQQIVAGLVTIEVLRFLFGHEPCQSIGRLITLSLTELTRNHETVLRLPDCPSCSAAKDTSTHSQWTCELSAARYCGDTSVTWHHLLVGRHVGIVRKAHELPVRWDDPRIVIVGAEMADLAALGGMVTPTNAGGVGLTYDEAWCGAVGEAAERYCASFLCDASLIPKGSWNELQIPAVDPMTFSLFSEAQYARPGFPYQRFDQTTKTVWVAGQRLRCPPVEDGEMYWLPAECVYLGYPCPEGEKHINVPTSTGLATGTTLEAAIQAGLCEVVERDAFIIAWRNTLSAPRIDLKSRSVTWLRDLLEDRFLWPRIDYHITDLTSDVGVPVYAVITRGPSEDGTIVSFGAACHPDARRALLKAILEAAMGRIYIRQLIRRNPVKRYRYDYADIQTFADHAQFYTRHPRRYRDLRRFVSSDRWADLSVLEETFQADNSPLPEIIGRFEQLGLTPCWCDLTTSDVRATGLHVVRALVPEMQPLHGDHRLPFLGGHRHMHPEQIFHWAGRNTRRRKLNSLPHPYP